MATRYWAPKAVAVAQVTTVAVTAYDAATTYKLTVGNVELVAEVGDTDTTTTAANMATAWEALTHIYATGITATAATGTITLTADTAGVPFTVSSSVSGGTGTIGSPSTTTSATGPNFIDDAENWDGGTLPANSDVLVFRDTSIGAVWGLDQLSTTGHTLTVDQSFSGVIGLAESEFATTADGQTTDVNAPEYRATYLELDCSRIEVGFHDGQGTPTGSGRIKIDNDRAGSSTTVVERTAGQGSETGKPAVRLLYANSGADIFVRSGSVGIGVDAPGETGTIGDVTAHGGNVYIGSGITWTNFTTYAGTHAVRAEVATVTQILAVGGTVEVRGDQAVTTLKARDSGEIVYMGTGTVTTASHDPAGGIIDYSRGGEAVTITTHNLGPNATLITDDDRATITTLNEPDGFSRLTVSS